MTDMETLREQLALNRLAGRAPKQRAAAPLAADRSGPLPLSFGQQGLWFLSRLRPESPEYLVPFALRLRGPLDAAALHVAARRLVARHEILRTRYVLADTEPRQVIDPPGPVALPVVEAADDGVLGLLRHEWSVPVDLEHEYPLRFRLLRLGPQDHVLSVVLHHIACDAMTQGLFIEELSALYQEETTGRPAGLPPVPAQYADYAVREHQLQSGPELQRRLDFWRRSLDGSTALELPTDRLRSAARGWAGDQIGFGVDVGVTDALREVAAELDTTLFVVLLTAFQVLLARHSGQDDIAVGSAVSVRVRSDEQRMFGYLQNTLVLRANVEGDPVFADLVERGRARTLDALVHREVALNLVSQALGGQRDLTGTPLFRAMFDLVDEVPAQARFAGLDCGFLNPGNTVARFDLTVQLGARADGGLIGSLNYATSLFDRSTAEHLVSHFLRLAAAVAGRPRARVSELDIVGAEERRVLLAAGDGGPRDRAWPTVSEAVARHAKDVPDDVAAVVCGADGSESMLCYAELDDRANRVARHLVRLGVGPETVIGVCAERDTWLLPTLLGVWRAGAAYVPLDPGLPDERARFVLEDSGARLVVARGEAGERLAGLHRGVTVDPDADTQTIDGHAAEPPPQQDPDTAAYIIYTSGSTGTPKGVLVTHRALGNYLSWAAGTYGDGDVGRGAPLMSSAAFDLAVTALFTPLLLGEPVYLLPPDVGADGLGAAVLRHAPYRFVKLTPGHLELLTRQLNPAQALALTGTLVVGGEAFPARLAASWPHARVVNEYGPTESTVGNSTYTARGTEDGEQLPIGRPLPGTTARVLDARLSPVPIGAVGELFIGGGQLARGYLGRPTLTAERFVPDPYGPPGARLYRTGDLCRLLPGGDLDFLGRSDRQLKVRGYRVEPGEIEAALTAQASVATAVVAVKEGMLVGYVVPEPGATVHAHELRAALERGLPSYMVPSAFVFLAEIPLTANGKTDFAALPAPARDDLPVQGYVAPVGEAQERVAEAWRSVLGRGEFGAGDSFFDVGGDSLHAVAVVGALLEAGFDVAVEDVFARPTIAELADLIGARPAAAPGEDALAPFALLAPGDAARVGDGVEDAYPLSRIQAGMVYEMLADDDMHNYLNTTTYDIRDGHPFSEPALREAAAIVVGRHDVLRTAIDLTGFSEPVQLVLARARLKIAVADLRGLAADEQNRRILADMAIERRTLFDLGDPTLLRVRVQIRDDATWALTITECHPILEGWSFHLLLMELLTCYRSLRSGRQPVLEELPRVRYADFIAAERAALSSDETRAFWRDVLGRAERLELPQAWAGSRAGEKPYYKIQVPFADLAPGLEAAARKARVPLKSILHAAHLRVMSMLTRHDEFFSGLVCDARPEAPGAERILGMFLNTVPFPFRLTATSWTGLAREVFATEIALWPHRRFPLPAMQREFGDGRRLIDVMFNFLDFRTVDEDLVDIHSTVDDSPNEFPLSVTIFRLGIVDLTFHAAVIGRDYAAELAELYRSVLEAIAADPDGDPRTVTAPTALPARPAEPAVAPARAVHELVAAHAAADPARTAVVADGHRLSYGRLNADANRLAHHLVGLGARPGSLVAVCLEAGPDAVTALLAVLKTGAAYVPLDPAHPGGRLSHCLADSGAALVVTRERYLTAIPLDGTVVPVCLDRDHARIAGCPDAAVDVPADPDGLAYVVYTSGSTGRPKGVMVTRRGFATYLSWAATQYGPAAEHGAPLLGSIAFDLSITNVFVPLYMGSDTHVLAPGNEIEALAGRLREGTGYTLVKATPSHMEMLRAALEGGTGPATVLDQPVAFVIGGEALHADAVAAWRRLAPAARFLNEYGPTETVVGCTVHESADGATGQVPIGRAIDGAAVHVLDADLRPVPSGVPGEIFAGGAGVARGYLGRPGLTAAAFVPDPYGPAGSRLYRTGDLGVRRPDGVLEFLGRLDDQVKIRGYRVEPGEIEARLRAHAQVRDAHVAARPDTQGRTGLVAYIIGDAGPDELTEFLRADLPDYMVPRAFVALEALPVGAGGKIDRALLPEADSRAADRRTPYAAPSTESERLLAGVWASTLGLERVGATDDFFDLGGDSILAMHAVAAARRAGLALAPRQLVRHRTVAAVAAALDAASDATGRRPDEAAAVESETGEVRPWPIRLIFAAEGADLTEYTQAAHVEVDPAPDPELLEQALHEVVAHHGTLRMRQRDGGLVIAEDEPGRLLAATDLSDTPVGAEADALRDLVTRVAPDPSSGPALRAVLARFGPGRPAHLVVLAHRLVVDGVSWRFLMEDLSTAYEARESGREAVLPPKTAPFRAWADRLAGLARTAEITRQLDGWLARGEHRIVPLDRPGVNDPRDVRELRVRIPVERPPADLHSALLAALLLAVTGVTGSHRLLVELEGHGRQDLFEDLDITRTTGWFTTLYPVELRLPGTAGGGVRDAVAAALRAVPDGGVGYGLLRYLGNEEHRRALAALPEPQIRFNYTGWTPPAPNRARFAPRSGGSPARPVTGTRSRHFEIDARLHDGHLEVIWAYSIALHDEQTVLALAEDHLDQLKALLTWE